jgi:hypothetical protein
MNQKKADRDAVRFLVWGKPSGTIVQRTDDSALPTQKNLWWREGGPEN